MKNVDKFLIGIVAGIILLVGVAFIIAFWRPKPSYQPEDTPGGVAHNYLFALQQKEYSRAYSYLSPDLAGYPASVDRFSDNLDEYSWQVKNLKNQSVALTVESTRFDNDRAVVSVRETSFYRGDLFDNNEHSNTFEITLQNKNGGWKIIKSDNYWVRCWNDSGGCSNSSDVQ